VKRLSAALVLLGAVFSALTVRTHEALMVHHPLAAGPSATAPAGTYRWVGVSCGSSSQCVAVGTYLAAPDANPQMAVDTFSSGAWEVSLPVGSPAAEVGINGVSCPATGACVAVGWSSDGISTIEQPMVVTLHDGLWQFENVPGAVSPGASLNVVSCPTASWCLAAGMTGAHNQTFTDTLANGEWSAATPFSYESQPTTITCAAAGACALGINQSVLEILSNGEWQLNTGWASANAVDLGAISCSTPSTCTATVGENSGWDTLAAALSRGVWTRHALPRPSGAGLAVAVGYISCIASTTCFAAGSYDHDGGDPQGVWEIEQKGKWRVETSVNAPGLITTTVMSVSCSSSTLCAMAGFGGNAEHQMVTWVEAGNDWTTLAVKWAVGGR
jgi:hypothetical protein